MFAPTDLRRPLLAWYRRHRRSLPWRALPGGTPDPYQVWVSEIMLQQTRVTAAIPYYARFLQRFPSAAVLAAAPAAEVLAAWSGLGYYRRARQLHAAAQRVQADHGGVFPLEFAAARALPGIGDYTAAAVLSIAANRPFAAVDGNGWRLARRLTGQALSLSQARALLTAALAPRRPGDFNQAVMDLGAAVCLPQAPRCPACPLRRLCRSRGPGPPAPKRPPARRVQLDYALIRRGCKIWLIQRSAGAAQMPGLWELPPCPTPAGAPLATLRHTITDHRIVARLFATPAPAATPGRWLTPAQAAAMPLTGLTQKFFRAL